MTVAGGPWVAPAVGSVHSCALASDGGVWCWGGNANGQLGSGDRTSRPEPRQVALPAKAVDVRTAFEFTCAVLADASAWCWGYNWEGQLGLGDVHPGDDHLEPIQLGNTRDWTFVATGQGHGCGIRSPGRLYCWGRNTESQLGQGTTEPPQMRAPVQVGADADWVAVGCSQSTTCARKRNGSLWCWGAQPSGALATGDGAARPDARPGADLQRLVGGRPSERFTPAAFAPAARSGARAATPKARSARPISSTRCRT